MQWMVLLVASVLLASPFGEATATAVAEDDDGLQLAISIEMDEAFEAVLVRPYSTFEELDPTALVGRENGTWGAVVTVPTSENWSIVFDAIRADGTWERSESTDLVELGVDPIVVSAKPAEPVSSEGIPTTTWWLIGGLILGLGALGALAWWAFMPNRSANEHDGDLPAES